MLLIPCPYCGAAAGDRVPLWRRGAYRARRSIPSQLDDAAWADFLYMRTNPKGLHAERWRHMHGCGRFFNCRARHGQRPHPRAPTRPASRSQIVTGRPTAMSRHVPHRRRWPHRSQRDRSPSRFDGETLTGLRRRHARLGAARQWRAPGRALLQVSPAARHPGGRGRGAECAGHRRSRRRARDAEPARDAGRALRGPGRAKARTAGRRLRFDLGAVSDWLAPLLPAGFYYKTFMWPGARLGCGASSTSR